MQKLPRPTSSEQREDLKRMTRAALRQVNAAKFSLVTRYEAGQLSKFGSEHPDDINKFMPVDVLADLQLELPRGVAASLLAELAALGGFRLVPIEEDGGEALDFDDVGAMAKEGGESTAASARAAARPTCLASVREARRELQEDVHVKSVGLRKLAQQERRIMAGGR